MSEVTLSNQERGKEWEYRVIADNKAGEGQPSNTVTAKRSNIMIKKTVGAILIVAVVWFIPLTAKAIEVLIRSTIMSFGTAQNLTDVNIGIAKAILALSLFLLLVVLFRQSKNSKT